MKQNLVPDTITTFSRFIPNSTTAPLSLSLFVSSWLERKQMQLIASAFMGLLFLTLASALLLQSAAADSVDALALYAPVQRCSWQTQTQSHTDSCSSLCAMHARQLLSSFPDPAFVTITGASLSLTHFIDSRSRYPSRLQVVCPRKQCLIRRLPVHQADAPEAAVEGTDGSGQLTWQAFRRAEQRN